MRISTDKPTILRVISEAISSMTGTDQSSLDAEYEKAVSSGDTEAALRMIRDRASTKMPDTKVVDPDGKPTVVYHGTEREFTVPRMGKDGFHAGRFAEQAFDRIESRSGKHRILLRLFMDIRNPLLTPDVYVWNPRSFLSWVGPEAKLTKEERTDLMKNPTGPFESTLLPALKSKGFDGIVYENTVEGRYRYGEGDETRNLAYVPFSPNQVKSADITYDDSGNLIPLSKRFDSSNPDIRY